MSSAVMCECGTFIGSALVIHWWSTDVAVAVTIEDSGEDLPDAMAVGDEAEVGKLYLELHSMVVVYSGADTIDRAATEDLLIGAVLG